MRLLPAATLLLTIYLASWIAGRHTCWYLGHDPHWTTCGRVRECARCHHLWLPAQHAPVISVAEMGCTTTTASDGW